MADPASPGACTWVFRDVKAPHSHDVRALAVLAPPGEEEDAVLMSGAADGQLIMYSAPRFLKVCAQRGV